jgi:hypothetical protein
MGGMVMMRFEKEKFEAGTASFLLREYIALSD